MTRTITVHQDAPNERAVSVRVLRSMDRSPASSDRYTKGSTRITYAKASQMVLESRMRVAITR